MSVVVITGPYAPNNPTQNHTAPIWVDASAYALTAAERAELFAGGAVQITQPGNMVFYAPNVALAAGQGLDVNLAPDGEHRVTPDVAVLADGTFVVTWADYGQEATRDYGLAAQRYSATGERIGAEFRVATYTADHQNDPAIAPLAGGGYVITWTSAGQDGTSVSVYLQAFLADGTKVGVEQRVNSESSGAQYAAEVAALAGGGFVVSWTSNERDIHAQVFDANAVKVGAQTVVNTTFALDQTESAVSAMSDGGFVVAWTSQRTGTGTDILAQRFDAAGGKIGAETLVNTTVADNQTSPGVTGLSGGRYVAAWLSTGVNAQAAVVHTQLFDASGAKIGGETQASYTAGEKGGVSVRALSDGGYMTVWHVDNQTIPPGETTLAFTEIYGQRYDANGVAVGGEIRLNSDSPNYQQWGAVASMADGSIVATWEGTGAVSRIIQAAIFSPVAFQTLTAGADVLAPDAHARLVSTTSANLTAADSLVGGAASDRLDLVSGDVLDLTAPTAFSGFEIINLTGANDRVIASGARLADVTFISGGYGTDVVELVGGGVTDFTNTRFSSVEEIHGSVADDHVILDQAADGMTLDGGAGVDILQVRSGAVDLSQWTIVGFETIRGTDGGFNANNILSMTTLPAGLELVDGGAVNAHNSLSFASATAGVNMTFTTQRIYLVVGSDYADTLRGGDDGVTFQGGGGDDVIYGGAGDDNISGGAGSNTLHGGGGRDSISIFGGLSADVTTGYGGDGNDTLTGSQYADRLYGDAGQDHIEGNEGNDLIDGGADLDFLLGGDGNDEIYGGDGNDQLLGHAGDDRLDGGAGDDRLTAGAGDDLIVGGDGFDWLYGDSGSDQLYGGAGTDWIEDGGETSNRDFLFGGSGSDVYIVTSSLTGPTDLIYEGGDNPDVMGGPDDVDVIYSRGDFFWDYYGVGEVLNIQRTGGAQLVGGTTNQSFFGSDATDQIIAYGGSNRVDAGAGTDAISFGLYGLDESYDGVNTLVMKAGNGLDYVYEFESGVDKIDLTAFHFGITGQQVLDQAVNVDQAGTANDYCYFYLTSAGGVDNYVAFIGLLSSQLQASDFIT